MNQRKNHNSKNFSSLLLTSFIFFLPRLLTAAESALAIPNISFEQKPIAFGLKAIIMKMDMPEDKGTDIVEEKLAKISGVSSITIEDYRRAFG